MHLGDRRNARTLRLQADPRSAEGWVGDKTLVWPLYRELGLQLHHKSANKSVEEARWVKHRRRLAAHGFKAHVGADAEITSVEEMAIIPANVHDGEAGGEALPGDHGEVFADSAYCGETFRATVQAKHRTPHIVATHI